MFPAANKKTKTTKTPWPIKLLAVFFILIILFVGLDLAYSKIYDQKIILGVTINSTDLGGKTREEARDLIQKTSDQLISKGLTFYSDSRKVNISPIISSPSDPDFTYEILSFNADQMADDALRTGHQKTANPLADFWSNLKEQAKTLIQGQTLSIKYNLNESELVKILKDNFTSEEVPALDAKLKIINQPDPLTKKPYRLLVQPEKFGRTLDYAKAIKELKDNISILKINPIRIRTLVSQPQISEKDVWSNLDLAENTLKLAPINLAYQNRKWSINRVEFANWLEFQYQNGVVSLNLNRNSLINYLESLAKEINIEAKDAKFEITDGRVTKFQTEEPGQTLDTEENYQKINHLIVDKKINQIELTVKESLPAITIKNANNLGIKEIIGVGKSNFRGSPKNRQHNIIVGVQKLNGLLIKPDEEFSLVKALGKINDQTGFLPELVIKGDRTIPEFGGGLCQIGTTTFRAVLAAGLPITARQNHSYRVPYYEPAGTDATIYDPWPDFRFVNDTGNYLLLVTKVEGTNLIFELWGTSDGRKVDQTKPRIYNIVTPPPLKIVKTTDLPPGEKNCTERAHDGADAEFSRTITYANGQVKTEIWRSHYKPWQAVCLLGVKPEELGPADQSNTIISPDSIQADLNLNANAKINTN